MSLWIVHGSQFSQLPHTGAVLWRFFVVKVVVCKALLDTLIWPDAGSRPKYFTLISWPTSRPRALG